MQYCIRIAALILNSVDNKNGMLNIEEGSILEILGKFKKQSNLGEHSILIYPDRYALREVCSRACKMSLENNEAVVMLLHYESREYLRAPALNRRIGSNMSILCQGVILYQMSAY